MMSAYSSVEAYGVGIGEGTWAQSSSQSTAAGGEHVDLAGTKGTATVIASDDDSALAVTAVYGLAHVHDDCDDGIGVMMDATAGAYGTTAFSASGAGGHAIGYPGFDLAYGTASAHAWGDEGHDAQAFVTPYGGDSTRSGSYEAAYEDFASAYAYGMSVAGDGF